MSASLTTDLRLLKLERRVERIERKLALEPPEGLENAFLEQISREEAAELREVPAQRFYVGRSIPMTTQQQNAAAPQGEAVGVPDERGYVEPPIPITRAPDAVATRIVTPPPLPPAERSSRLAYEAIQPKRPAPPSPVKSRQLEQTIGLKWAGWVGAVVLVIGAVLGIKYAYDTGLLPTVGPTGRTMLVALAGAILIGTGEYVYRTINKISATGLFGAGVATLFIAAYVGHAYKLYPPNVTMMLMGAAALIGSIVAMRGNLVSIAVLSLVGANIAPMLVGSRGAPIGPFLAYLVAMQVVALTLSAWGRASKWWTLRGLSLVLTAFWMLAVLFGSHRTEGVVLVFLLGSAALYHAELIVSALLGKGTRVMEKAAGATFALIVTAALTLGLLRYFVDATPMLRGTWIVSLSIASFIAGLTLPRLREVLKPLAQIHRIAAAALLVLAVPIATTGVRAEIGWGVLAIGFAVSWVITGSRVSRIAAPVTWMLALWHVLDSASQTNVRPTVWLTLFHTPIVSHAILFAGGALLGQIIARLISTTRAGSPIELGTDRAIRAMSVVATLVWTTAAIAYLPALGATLALVLYAWLLMGADRFAERLSLAVQAGAILLIATVKWAIVDTLAQRLSPDWSPTRYLPVLNPMMGVGALVTASLVALYFLKRRAILTSLKRDEASNDAARGAAYLASIVIALVMIGLSFEVEHVIERAVALGYHSIWPLWQMKQLAWTVLWSIATVAIALIVSRIIRDRADRARRMRFIWILPIALVVKYLFIDTLLYRLSGVTSAHALLNLQMLAGAATIGSLLCVRAVSSPQRLSLQQQLRGTVGLLVVGMIAWMGTLEIDRAIERGSFSSIIPLITTSSVAWHVKMLLWTIWWTLLAGSAYAFGCLRDRNAASNEPWLRVLPGAIVLIAIQFVVIDLVGWRLMHGSPVGWPVLVNVECLATACVLASVVMLKVIRAPERAPLQLSATVRVAMGLLVATLFIAGSLEVDRAFSLPAVRAALTNAQLAEQVALSIFWATFAVSIVAIGFRVRAAGLRYAGLALLAMTLLKVVFVDLSQVGTGYRILSFIGLGIVLLGTSVLYGKVSPKLLATESSAGWKN